MTVIVLAAVGFLACAFYLFVLFEWTRDTKRKTTTVDHAAGETDAKKRLQIVSPRRNIEKQDRSSGSSGEIQGTGGQSRDCGPGCSECERIAYEKVARLLRSGKRT
jgi:hypothetical protein